MKYTDIAKYFGAKISDTDFQKFLKSIDYNPGEYDVAKSNYIYSDTTGIEIGFRNTEAIYDDNEQIVLKKGNPVFYLFNIYPISENFLKEIPFDIKFSDTIKTVRKKAGTPTKIVDFENKLFNKRYLIDHYKIDNLAISVDYNSDNGKVELIQIRDNNLTEPHTKL